MNIGLAMGTFGPMHNGHVAMICNMLDVHKMDKVYIIPCFSHPYGKKMLSFWHRYVMCWNVAKKHFDDRVIVSQIEETLGGVSLTCNTLERLVEVQPDDRFFIGMGADVLTDLPNWVGFDSLIKYASIIAFPRYDACISSTLVRNLFRQDRSISDLVPACVEEYMNEHRDIFIERWFGSDK